MTTIAASLRTHTIVCDRQFSHSNGLKFKGATKCYEINKEVAKELFGVEEAVIGACGDADGISSAWGWLSTGGKLPNIKGTEFLMLTKDKLLTSRNLKDWLVVDQPDYAIGSGCHIALGAMAAGKTPKEAVVLASKHDPFTGHGTKEYTVK